MWYMLAQHFNSHVWWARHSASVMRNQSFPFCPTYIKHISTLVEGEEWKRTREGMKERKDDKLWCNKRNQADSIPFHETRESGREQTTDTNDTRTLHTHTHTHLHTTWERQAEHMGDSCKTALIVMMVMMMMIAVVVYCLGIPFWSFSKKRKGNRNSLPLFERVIRWTLHVTIDYGW